MRILVTGAAGFLGSHLCDRLLHQGHHVIGIDNFLTGHAENLTQAMQNPVFEFIEHDVMEPFILACDQIYHLASPASPPMYQKSPVDTAKINFLGTLNVLELARKTGARMLLASTSETYGDPDIHPQPEHYHGNVNQTGPRACYGEGKRIAETLTFDFHRQYGVDTRVVRIFNTYGPRLNTDDGRVISNFIDQPFRGEEITIFGDGSQTRSFCYHTDLVDGLMRMMNTDKTIGPVNLGNPEDDPKQRCPDISKAKALLDWTPTVALRDGLIETIAFITSHADDGKRAIQG